MDVANQRIALIGGPISRSNDRKFSPSGAPKGFKAIGIPREYFKIVGYRDAADNAMKVLAFKLSQSNLITGRLEALASNEIDLEKFEMFQVKVSTIEKLTGLSMPAFRKLDVFGAPQGIAAERLGEGQASAIQSFADIMR